MPIRLLIASTALLVLAGPVFADCDEEIASLRQAVTEAETGASTTTTGLPATEHQKEVLAGEKRKQGETTGAGKPVAPVSPHQQQVLKGGQGNAQQPALLLAEAKDKAKAGDEQGCMQDVAQVKSLLGIK